MIYLQKVENFVCHLLLSLVLLFFFFFLFFWWKVPLKITLPNLYPWRGEVSRRKSYTREMAYSLLGVLVMVTLLFFRVDMKNSNQFHKSYVKCKLEGWAYTLDVGDNIFHYEILWGCCEISLYDVTLTLTYVLRLAFFIVYVTYVYFGGDVFNMIKYWWCWLRKPTNQKNIKRKK